jgi:transcriptional repressor NrdR
MKCPTCKKFKTQVIDSRSANKGMIVRRRRVCLKCKRRFTTYERPEERGIKVIKKDGRHESFDRGKVRESVEIACNKRPVSTRQIENVLNRVEHDVYRNHHAEIPSRIIGDIILTELKKLDKVAYLRFASVYREFEDVHQFVEEAKNIKLPRSRSNAR